MQLPESYKPFGVGVYLSGMGLMLVNNPLFNASLPRDYKPETALFLFQCALVVVGFGIWTLASKREG
jgi:hypothetical protein